MAVDLADVHARALEQTGAYVASVRAEQWGDPTPCKGWDVRVLVNHVVSGNLWAGELMAGRTIEEVGDRLEGDVLGDDPVAAYWRSAEIARDAFDGPDAMDRPAAVSYGPVPGFVYCGHRFVDVLIHGWDLARATGQDTCLPDDLVEACWEVIEPQRELLAGSGMFGSQVPLPLGADRQAALLAGLGRHA